jgi:hypothetical protein
MHPMSAQLKREPVPFGEMFKQLEQLVVLWRRRVREGSETRPGRLGASRGTKSYARVTQFLTCARS